MIVKHLVEKGADIGSTDSQGSTALHLAGREGRLLVVQFLVEKGADPVTNLIELLIT